jgi:hypothetical protein
VSSYDTESSDMDKSIKNVALSFFFIVLLFTNANLALARWAGDVIGRDLNVTGLGSLGHIAMDAQEFSASLRSSLFLEVLNEGAIIFKNTYQNFKSRSKVWSGGERYWAPCEQTCSHSWKAAISSGWEQRNWSPSYTLAAAWVEGKMIKVNGKWVRQNAKFRCDSFVIFSYRKGINRDIQRNPQTPSRIWQGLPYNYSWDDV